MIRTRAKRYFMLGSLTAGICFLIGVLSASQLPKARAWVLVEIERQTRLHLPIRILPTSVDIDFLPLGATLSGVRIIPKDDIKDILDPLEIKRLSATISLWQLLQGHLRLSSVEAEGAHISVRIPKSTKKDSAKPLEGLFARLSEIPVSRLRVQDISIYAQVNDPSLNVSVHGLDMGFEKIRGGLKIALEHATAHIQDPDSRATVLLDLEAELSANSQHVIVESVKIRRGDSFFIASGQATGDTEALVMKEFDLKIRSEIFLDSMRNWLTKTFAKEGWARSIPALKGRAFANGHIQRPRGQLAAGDIDLRLEGFAIEKIKLGRIETRGTYTKNVLHLPVLKIANPATTSTIQDINVDFNEYAKSRGQIGLEGRLTVPSLNLNELLYQSGVGRIPVAATIEKGDLPCRGTLRPRFALDCKAIVSLSNLLVEDGVDKRKTTIVRVSHVSAQGDVHVDDQAVSYKAAIAMADSKGQSEGVINYDQGFKIAFDGERVSFKDVANLANLKLEGVVHVKGETAGTSQTGKVSLKLSGDDIWFEDFWLGNVKGGLNYGAGQLKFSDLSGSAAISRYNGDVTLDLGKKRIAAAARFPFLDARDVLKVFSRRVQLPFAVLGQGQASLKASGPLDLGHLSYDLRSSLYRGTAAGENFDQAHFDVKSNGGEVKAERVQLIKGAAVIALTGNAHPDGKIQTTIRSRGLKVEDTNTVARSGFAVSGGVDFEMTMNGPVLSPETDLRGSLTRMSIGDQSMPDSSFRLKFTKSAIEGAGKFLGDVVDGQFILPLNSEAPFKFKVVTKDWNFAPLFAAVAGPSSRKDYEGVLSTSVDLSSPSGGFWNSSGDVSISKLLLARGSLKLQNSKPMTLSMKSGQLHAQDVALSGENIFLNVQDSPSPSSKLDLLINGKVDVSLFALVTPFLEDLRGLLSFKLQAKGGNSQSSFIGSAYVEKGYLKFFDFPHAFEDIRADLLFNQQKIVFNTIRSEFGGGRVTANGGMEIKGYRDTPLNLTGTFEKITLNVPDKMQTSGSGDFTFSGKTFPFLLKGNYNISDGLLTKSFTGDSAEAYAISRRDAYLPDFLVQENFVPMVMDFNVDLSKGMAIKNDLVDGRTIGQLSIKGNPSKPAIGGTLATDKDSKVFFRNTTFDVVSGTVQFNGTPEIDPHLYVSARTRIDPYDVNLLVQGTGTKPELLLSSTPQLAEKDIVSLLAFGATDTNLDNRVKSQQQSANIGQIGASGLVQHNPISDAIKERLGFDVQFTTGFDDTNTSVQKIVATRQLGQKLTFSTGYSYGNSQSAEARIRYRLNDRLSLVGAYEENNSTEVNVQQSQIESQPNVFGLDMEYKLEFK